MVSCPPSNFGWPTVVTRHHVLLVRFNRGDVSSHSRKVSFMSFINITRSFVPVLATVSLATVPAAAELDEEHFDIAVWNDGGTLRTGGWDHDTEMLVEPEMRVFEAHFGEDPSFPFSIDEPGIGGVAADLGLSVGSTLTLRMAAGLGVWNGAGFSAAGTSMTADYGPLSVGSAMGGDLDFLISDDYDLHPVYSIDPTAATGAYILEFSAMMDGLASSESFWIVFNLGLDDLVFEEAVEWTEANYAPAPGALVAFGVAGMASRRRRRG
jgi:hypothetical protein